MINRDRIRQARELRDLTQIDLARKVGVNQSTIAYIESGRLMPSMELLSVIAQEVGFPDSFFELETQDDFPLGSLVLFRARATVSSREESQAHRYAQIAYEAAQWLARRIKTMPLRLPRLVDDDPEVAAKITRASFGLSPDTPIHNLIFTLEKAGILILALPLSISRIDAFSLWAGGDADKPVIALLSDAPGDRLRFSVAHEVSHLVMHQTLRGNIHDIEREADRFAGALLLPEPAMRAELVRPLTLTSLAALKRRWGVSMQTLVMRAFELEMIRERQKRYLFQQLSSRGWRTKEPDALNVPLERPRALRQMAELLYGLPINYKRLAKDTCLTEEFVRGMIEVHAAQNGESNIVQFSQRKRKFPQTDPGFT